MTSRRVYFIGKVIDHDKHRYATFGDYQTLKSGESVISVSAAPDWRWEFCGLVHELVECYLCRHAGVEEHDITAFDTMFERERSAGLHDNEAEPGDDPRAPYRKQHFIAMTVERIVAAALDVDWKAYNHWISSLP